MRNLVRRHMLTQRATGRSHTFSAIITEEEHQKLIMKKMLDEFFDGDSATMIKILKGLNVAEKKLVPSEAKNVAV